MKKRIHYNEYLRLKASELEMKIRQVQQIITKNNLYRGLVIEDVLRDFLKEFLPAKMDVCQGFIEYDGQLSSQCDIIIYDKTNYSALCSFGSVKIIPAKAVCSIIEVKTKINRNHFCKFIDDCKKLYVDMGIINTYLFVQDAIRINTIEAYFYDKPRNNTDTDTYTETSKYDWSDKYWIPNGVLSLSNNLYLKQDYIQDDNNDYFGYVAYGIKDNYKNGKEGKPLLVSCLQLFLQEMLSSMNQETDSFPYYPSDCEHEDSISDIKVIGGFSLFTT